MTYEKLNEKVAPNNFPLTTSPLTSSYFLTEFPSSIDLLFFLLSSIPLLFSLLHSLTNSCLFLPLHKSQKAAIKTHSNALEIWFTDDIRLHLNATALFLLYPQFSSTGNAKRCLRHILHLLSSLFDMTSLRQRTIWLILLRVAHPCVDRWPTFTLISRNKIRRNQYAPTLAHVSGNNAHSKLAVWCQLKITNSKSRELFGITSTPPQAEVNVTCRNRFPLLPASLRAERFRFVEHEADVGAFKGYRCGPN